MIFVYILLLVLAIVIFLLMQSFKVWFYLNITGDNAEAEILAPFIKMRIFLEDKQPMAVKKLLNFIEFKRKIKFSKRKNSNIKLLNMIDIKYMDIRVYYGFHDPAITGILAGIFSIASVFIDTQRISQYPQFVIVNEFICINGVVMVNLMKSAIKIFQKK